MYPNRLSQGNVISSLYTSKRTGVDYNTGIMCSYNNNHSKFSNMQKVILAKMTAIPPITRNDIFFTYLKLNISVFAQKWRLLHTGGGGYNIIFNSTLSKFLTRKFFITPSTLKVLGVITCLFKVFCGNHENPRWL